MSDLTSISRLPHTASRRWPRLLLLLLTFASGVVVGAVGGARVMRDQMLAVLQHPEGAPDRILSHLRSELVLNDDQARKVEEIVRRRHAAMESVRAESYPQQLLHFTAIRTEVAEILTDDQRARWTDLCKTLEERYLPATPRGPPPAHLLFTRFDTNGDQTLSEDEVPPRVWLRLRRADADGDGKVTLQEYQNARPGGEQPDS